MTIVNLCDRCGKQCQYYGNDYELVEIQPVSNKPEHPILCIDCHKLLKVYLERFWSVDNAD